MEIAEDLKGRTAYLFALADNLSAKREEWASDEYQQDLPADGPFYNAAEELIEAFAIGTITGACRKLAIAVDDFALAWQEYTERMSTSIDPGLLPGPKVWKAVDAIVFSRQQAKPKPPQKNETVETLVKEKVSYLQIAKIYKWKTEDGEWDINKVLDAIENPGKWDGSGKVSINYTDALAKDAAVAKSSKATNKQIASKAERKKDGVDSGLESIEDYIRQGVTISQIAKNRNCSVEQVLFYCNEVGIEPTAMHDSPYPSRAPQEPQLSETESNRIDASSKYRSTQSEHGYDDSEDSIEPEETEAGGDLESDFDKAIHPSVTPDQRVLDLADAGMKNSDIADEVGISRQKVTWIIKQRIDTSEPVPGSDEDFIDYE